MTGSEQRYSLPVPFTYDDFDLSDVRTYPLASRQSKVKADDFAKPAGSGATIGTFVDGLPNILAAADFKAVVAAIRDAHDGGRGVLWGLGAHVIKTGVSPILIDLMNRGFVSAIATNGAGVIHDFELALSGATSEEVDEALGPGRFGMADETGRLLNVAINDGVAAGLGIGQAGGRRLREMKPAHESLSILAAAAHLDSGDRPRRHQARHRPCIRSRPAPPQARAACGLPLLRLQRRRLGRGVWPNTGPPSSCRRCS